MDSARRTFGTGTGFCTALATLGAVLGWNFADSLLYLLATPASVHAPALAYLKISFLSMPFTTFSMMVSMSLRGVGDARTPLYAMILTSILGIVLNPLLILGLGPFPQLGIAGSALANALASVAGSAVMVAWVYWRDLPLRLRGKEFAYLLPRGDDLAYVMAKGLPMGAQMLLSSAASLIFVGLVNREGVMTAAAYGALLQVWNYIQMPAFTISMAVSAMVAQCIGAGKHERVGHITNVGVIANTVATLFLAVLLVAFDGPMFGLFLGSHSGAIPIAEHIQLIATWAWVVQGVGMILSGTLRAYGVVIAPLFILVIALYPARLGFYFLGYPTLGGDALWWAYPFGSAISLVLSWWLYTRGNWRRMRSPAPVEVFA
jgi:putative MATE family efflux protein